METNTKLVRRPITCRAMRTHRSAFFADLRAVWLPLLCALVGIAAIATAASAQTIAAANYSGAAFDGWRRTTTDVEPPALKGTASDGSTWVVGHAFGVGLHVLDVRLHLDASTARSATLAPLASTPWTLAPLQADPLTFFGGVPVVNGTVLQLLTVEADGAAYAAHFRSRIGPMLVAELWAQWYPDQPGWCSGEVVVTASNPSVPDVVATVPAGVALTWGNASVVVAGTSGNVLVAAGEHVADGQCRSMPLTIVWPDRLRSPTEWTSAGAVVSQAIAVQGCARVWPLGNPSSGTPALTWTRSNFSQAFGQLHAWTAGPLGVNASSNDTGAQEDEVFVGAECAAGVPGAATVRYLTALRQSARPCHHLEANGGPLILANHPNLVFWDGRPHWSLSVSPDQLGKSRGLTTLDTHGWWGPDVEHAFHDTLTVAARLTGSDALQFDLECVARVYLLQWTVKPGLSTSQPYAGRAIGWEALLACDCWWTLRDRVLAAQVRDRWLARLDAVLLPQLSSKANDIWDVRLDDPRLGTGAWWIPWQASVGAYGMDLGGRTFGRADARALALRAARRVVSDAWILNGTRWTSRAQESVDGTRGTADESFNLFGMPMSVATVLLADPTDAKALAIWRQLQVDAAGGCKWFPPELVLR
jgi:hypothetical protein